MRIAVVVRDRCKPRDCNYLCFRICPMVQTGKEAIVVEEGKPIISETLCSGCGICVKKCPYEAIRIVRLPEELEGKGVHRYSANGFVLFNLPAPKRAVVGLLGPNGIGKSTVLRILAGQLKPNLGNPEREVGWDEVVEAFRGKEVQPYLEGLASGEITTVLKPQRVDLLPKCVRGEVEAVLKSCDERGLFEEIVSGLGIESCLKKSLEELSGGELQRVAIAACLLRERDAYLLDEPSSFLDVAERLNAARLIRESLQGKHVFVVEHDLIVLDYLSDYVHILYGEPGAYGVISNVKGVRTGINEYLRGYLKSENVRFRETEVVFDVKAAREGVEEVERRVAYPSFKKRLGTFELDAEAGELKAPGILVILGRNAVGKTTFLRTLAGELEASEGEVKLNLKVSHKPQYIKPSEGLVGELGLEQRLVEQLGLGKLLHLSLEELSGGELQAVEIASCLSRGADLYLLDEPSAFLDVEQRLRLAKLLHRFCYEKKVPVVVVEHDLLLADYLADELLVFTGEPGKRGKASKPLGLREGMNAFLRQLGITFRRDPETGRPRVNKPGSSKDREQKEKGEFFYVG